MSSKIICYIDCVSPYSYYAFTYLRKHRPSLESHNVEVDFIPFFLGGIMVGSGNKPPWMAPAKAVYSDFDTKNAKRYFELPNVTKPTVFPIMSLKPQRGLCYIKEHFPNPKFEEALRLLWVALWENNIDVSQEPLLSATWSNLFTPDELKLILEATNLAEYKKKLLGNTEEALESGAFGAPWFIVRNSKGEESPFFGSDRFHFMFQFLELPMSDISIAMGPRKTSKL